MRHLDVGWPPSCARRRSRRNDSNHGCLVSITETAARTSLRTDGRFCVVVGALVALASPSLADPLGLPLWLTVLVGLVSAAWGVWLHRLAGSEQWVTAITGVAIVNFAAGIGLAAFALTPGGARLRLFMGGLVALAVLWFAVTQAIIRWNAQS